MNKYDLIDHLTCASTGNPPFPVGSLLRIDGAFIKGLPGGYLCGHGIAMVVESGSCDMAVVFAYGDMETLDPGDMTLVGLNQTSTSSMKPQVILSELGQPYICPTFIWEKDYRQGDIKAVNWQRVIEPPRTLAQDTLKGMLATGYGAAAGSTVGTVANPHATPVPPIPQPPTMQPIPEPDLCESEHSDQSEVPTAAPCRDDRLIPETYQPVANGQAAMDIIKKMFGG